MARAPVGFTKPEAGVMATRPATAPEIMPNTEGFLETIHSTNIGNYDPSQGISEFDKTNVTNVLETIAGSFMFLS